MVVATRCIVEKGFNARLVCRRDAAMAAAQVNGINSATQILDTSIVDSDSATGSAVAALGIVHRWIRHGVKQVNQKKSQFQIVILRSLRRKFWT